MPARAASPTPSENEVDISASLFTSGRVSTKKSKNNDKQDDDLGFDFLDDGDDDGDEAFIALKQAASFRKTGNLKGKSVKKGGGFQAMGSYTLSTNIIVVFCVSNERDSL